MQVYFNVKQNIKEIENPLLLEAFYLIIYDKLK